jgi:hypothetical protein
MAFDVSFIAKEKMSSEVAFNLVMTLCHNNLEFLGDRAWLWESHGFLDLGIAITCKTFEMLLPVTRLEHEAVDAAVDNECEPRAAQAV